MTSIKSVAAAAALALFAAGTAGAQVNGQKVTDPIGPLLELSAPGSCAVSCSLLGFGTITGGSIYFNSEPSFAARPTGTVGNFLAAGPSSGTPALLTFDLPQLSIGFLWGSPDTYNSLEVLHSGGSTFFSAAGLGFSETGGSQGFAQYVRFDAEAGSQITGLRFISPTNAFEVSNFSVPAGGAQVPEPATLALFAVGLVGLAGTARRRRQA